MLRKYKEIFYGFLIGLGAWTIDAAMHAQSAGRSFWAELVWPQGVAMVYRLLFIAFGLALGWSLWKKNVREREFRRLAEVLERFHREIVGPTFLIHGKLEVVLTRKDMSLSPSAEEMIRFIYGQSQLILSLAKERLPSEIPT